MTIRRRFFPSKTAQRIPGHSVDVEVQLTPAGAAEAACQCEVDSVIWVPLAREMRDEEELDYSWLELPGFNGENLQSLEVQLREIYWGGGVSEYLALPIGPSVCGVEWQWQWSASAAPDGTPWEKWSAVEQIGPYLKVALTYPLEEYFYAEQWEITLTAAAMCNGATIGPVMMRVWEMPA